MTVVSDEQINGEQNEQKLKPCPFCGGEPRLEENSGRLANNKTLEVGYEVYCPGCHVYYTAATKITVDKGKPVVKENGYKKCIEMWNRRV